MQQFERQLMQIQDEGFGMFSKEPLNMLPACCNCLGSGKDWAELPCGFCNGTGVETE